MNDYEISKETNRTKADYIINIKRPDGLIIQILIPIENDDDLLKYWQQYDRLDKPVGLNLYTEGHYG